MTKMMAKMIAMKSIHPRTANTAATATVAPLPCCSEVSLSTGSNSTCTSLIAVKLPYPTLVLARI